MPFHFCADELFAILAMLPFIGIFFKKIHTWYHKNSLHKCHEEKCHDTHVEHINEEECPQHPLMQIEDWDEVPVELIKEKFGEELVLKLRMHPLRLGLWDVPSENDFRWYLNGAGVPKAVLIHTMEFIYSHEYESWDNMP
jgi:hypothetical protein